MAGLSGEGGWLTEAAPAKVNLFLHVVGRRADGYHLLDSLAVFPGPGDVLHAAPADGLSLEVRGPFAAGLGAGEDNLVLRAARGLAAVLGRPALERPELGRPGLGARLILEKNLPVASGIGGGSADAAAALRVLSRMWGGSAELARIAAGLGADVPACLRSQPVRMGGVGDVLDAAPALPGCGVLLANPGVAVSTPEVFRGRTGGFVTRAELPPAWRTAERVVRWIAAHGKQPGTSSAGDRARSGRGALDWVRGLPGCLFARMSGSGATCFGLFGSEVPAVQPRPGWWAAAGRIGPPP